MGGAKLIEGNRTKAKQWKLTEMVRHSRRQKKSSDPSRKGWKVINKAQVETHRQEAKTQEAQLFNIKQEAQKKPEELERTKKTGSEISRDEGSQRIKDLNIQRTGGK